MNRIFILALLISTTSPAWAQSANAAEAAATTSEQENLPETPNVQVARLAYNEGRYTEAARGFRRAALEMPENALIYRALARACTYANDFENSVRAYRNYLKLAPIAADRDKIEAELALAMRKLDAPLPEGPPAGVKQALEAAQGRVEAGQFTGPDGAFGALDALVGGDYVGPELSEGLRAVSQGLEARSDEAIDHWFRTAENVKSETLAELSLAWEEIEKRKHPMRNAGRYTSKLDGLIELRDNAPEKALEFFGATAPSDHRIRFAQVIALLALERNEEAAALLTTLSQGPVSDPRFNALLALTEIRIGQRAEGEARLRDLLEVE